MTKFTINVVTLWLLTLTLTVAGYSQLLSQSAYDETYAPKSLRGLKALNVRGEAYVFPRELLGSELKHSDIQSRVEGMLNKAFTEELTSYDFPTHWKGKVECKITQTLFGGRHKDAWEGTIESSIFEINLPLEIK